MMSPTPATRRFEPPSTLMHWTRLAPLLSATSRLDCIWIIVRPYSLSILRSGVRVGDVFGLGLLRRLLGGLLCLFLGRLRGLGLGRGNDFRLGDLDGADLGGTNAVKDRPGLQLRDRGALFNAHDLAGAELVRRVVSVVLLRQLDDLAVQRVLHPPLDTDHDRLVTLVGHHGAGEDALWHLKYSLRLGRIARASGLQRLDPGDGAAHHANPGRLFKLVGGGLEAQVELLALQFAKLGG